MFDAKRYCERFCNVGHNGLLGLRHVADGVGFIELSMPFSSHLSEPGKDGQTANGAIAALIDMTGTTAVWTRTGKFRPHATLSLRIDYLCDCSHGEELRARGECETAEQDIAHVRGTAFTTRGGVFAQFFATYMFTKTGP